MNITLRIRRYHPETDDPPWFDDFEVSVEPTDRLLNALMFIKRNLDGTLCFRKSCAHGVFAKVALTVCAARTL